MANFDNFDWSVLSGPRVSRRTLMKVASATAAVPFASWLAACGGDDDDDDDDDDDEEAAADPTSTPPASVATPTSPGQEDDEEEEEEEEEPEEEPTEAEEEEEPEEEPTPTEEEEETDGDGRQGGTLVFGMGTLSQILTIDPAQVTQGIVAGQLVSNIFSSLVQFDENLGLFTDLAEDWEVSGDGLEYTFHLREGLTFHNGDSLTAEDFVYTFERTTNEEFASPHSNKLDLVTEITAVDELTLNMVLEAPFAPFLAVACSRGPGRAMTPVPQSAVEEMGDEQFGLEPVGCGPFRVVPGSREVGEGLELEAFEDWYGGRPYLDSIVVQVIPEPSSQASALEAGDIDMINIVPLTQVEQLQGNDNLTMVELPSTSWTGLMMNYERPPWDNPTARMAIAKAINPEEYVERAFFGLAVPSHSAIAPAFGWVYHQDDEDNPQAYNLEEAQALAEEAGIAGTTANIMALSDDPRTREVMRTILSEIGVELEIDNLQSAALNERWQAGDFDMHINGSVVDADPDDGHWNFYHSTGPWNTYGYNSERADELLEQTRLVNDPDERREIWLELEQVLQEEVPYVFLSHAIDFTAFQNDVMDLPAIPEIRQFENVWLDR